MVESTKKKKRKRILTDENMPEGYSLQDWNNFLGVIRSRVFRSPGVSGDWREFSGKANLHKSTVLGFLFDEGRQPTLLTYWKLACAVGLAREWLRFFSSAGDEEDVPLTPAEARRLHGNKKK